MSLPLEPVAAYDRIAPVFADLAEQRSSYLSAVERLVAATIPPGSRSLLDVGAGDGARAGRIARSRGISEIALLEPAAAMQRGNRTGAQVWTMRAEDLHRVEARFDVILCLWNVLGHIFPSSSRVEALRQFARLLSPGGKAFVDVNHRYNLRHYGTLPTALRFLRDALFWREENGDVEVTWAECTTRGHVFTHREFESLCRTAGMAIERKFVVDYATGQERRWDFEGHLLYRLTPFTR